MSSPWGTPPSKIPPINFGGMKGLPSHVITGGAVAWISGALLAKLFGRPEEEDLAFTTKAGKVRDIGVRIAMSNRVFFTALTLEKPRAKAGLETSPDKHVSHAAHRECADGHRQRQLHAQSGVCAATSGSRSTRP